MTLDTLIDGMKPACNLQAMVLKDKRHLCSYNGDCAYQAYKGGVYNCRYLEQLHELSVHQCAGAMLDIPLREQERLE